MFSRPVAETWPISHFYGEKGGQYSWSIDPDNGLWIPAVGPDGLGQHCGTDFSCPVGTMVRAMADGIIIRARFENAINSAIGAGLYIIQLLDHIDYQNWALRYTHLSEIFVHPGQMVLHGQPIGESGKTGAVADAYLHVDLMNLRKQWRPIPLELQITP